MFGSGDKGHSSHYEGKGGSPERLTFGQKVKRHYRKYWWLHLIIFIVVTLVITLPVVYVGYPNIAQKGISNSRLVLVSQSATNPRPRSIRLNMDTMFISGSKYHPELDAFEGSLYLEGRDDAFASFQVPALKAHNGSIAHVDQEIQITNMEEFTRYTSTALASKEYSVHLKGKGGLKLGSLPKTTVHYNKKITVAGLDGLKSTQLTSLDLLAHGPPDANALGTVSIFNPSVQTLDLGNVSISMFGPKGFEKLPLGDSVMINTLLKPGNNTINLRSIINQTSVATVVTHDPYRCGIFEATIRGNNVTYDGQLLPYYSESLKQSDIKTMLNVRKSLTDIGYSWVILNQTECLTYDGINSTVS